MRNVCLLYIYAHTSLSLMYEQMHPRHIYTSIVSYSISYNWRGVCLNCCLVKHHNYCLFFLYIYIHTPLSLSYVWTYRQGPYNIYIYIYYLQRSMRVEPTSRFVLFAEKWLWESSKVNSNRGKNTPRNKHECAVSDNLTWNTCGDALYGAFVKYNQKQITYIWEGI